MRDPDHHYREYLKDTTDYNSARNYLYSLMRASRIRELSSTTSDNILRVLDPDFFKTRQSKGVSHFIKRADEHGIPPELYFHSENTVVTLTDFDGNSIVNTLKRLPDSFLSLHLATSSLDCFPELAQQPIIQLKLSLWMDAIISQVDWSPLRNIHTLKELKILDIYMTYADEAGQEQSRLYYLGPSFFSHLPPKLEKLDVCSSSFNDEDLITIDSDGNRIPSEMLISIRNLKELKLVNENLSSLGIALILRDSQLEKFSITVLARDQGLIEELQMPSSLNTNWQVEAQRPNDHYTIITFTKD